MANQIIPTVGFTPSVDPTIPNAVLNCTNLLPTLRGMKSGPSATNAGSPALPSRVLGAAAVTELSGTKRVFAGTATNLYENVSNAWVDVSRTAGGAYTGGANQWRYCQFGNATIASNGQDKIQQSVLTGAFSDIASAPAARIVEVTQGFVFAFDTTDATNGHRTNGWACSALFDQTNWTPSQATQAANGVIIDTPGGITAGKALGTNMVVYKKESMFYGTYQGVPVIWAFNQISPIVGTPCQEAVVNVGTSHVFLGSDSQVYVYDGSRPVPVGDDVKDWLHANWNPSFQDIVQSYHDKENTLVYWYFCSNASTGTPDRSLVFNYRTGKFGRADAVVEATVQYISGQITWDGLGSLPGVTTWDTLPAIPYNSSFWTSAAELPAYFDASHTLFSLTGVAADSSLTTSYFGDDEQYSYLQRVVPRFADGPDSCLGTGISYASLGDSSGTAFTISPLYDGIMNTDVSGRWYSVTLRFTGNTEILGFIPKMIRSGTL